MKDNSGRVLADQALAVPAGPVARPSPSGFDPSRVEPYALGLLVEEMGEALCHIGRALRFGIDTLGQDGTSEREGLARELGDVFAATDYASAGSVVDAVTITRRAGKKLGKLLDPNSRDNLGRRLAPAIATEATQKDHPNG